MNRNSLMAHPHLRPASRFTLSRGIHRGNVGHHLVALLAIAIVRSLEPEWLAVDIGYANVERL